MSSKKSAYEVVLDKFLKAVDEKSSMPWQRPYEMYNAFNYFTGKTYRGINRLVLPFGEYITANQINEYNKKKDYIVYDERGKIKSLKPEAYRFVKGIIWYPVIFFKTVIKSSSIAEVEKNVSDWKDNGEDGFIGKNMGWVFYREEGKFLKKRNVLRFYEVADRKYFMNAYGECLPSKVESGEVVITKPEPMKVILDYVKRSGVSFVTNFSGVPNYSSFFDRVSLNPYIENGDFWFSIAFHELAHSTGYVDRLDREGVGHGVVKGSEKYAKEECIAEITSFLCCAETGVYDFRTTCSNAFENNIAYVKYWKEKIHNWGKEFIYIVSQADKAFNYICNGPDATNDEGEEK